MRFVATLMEGQSLIISVPGELDEPSKALEISRAEGKLMLANEKVTSTRLVSSGK